MMKNPFLSTIKQRKFSLALLVIVIIAALLFYFFQIRPAKKYYDAHHIAINGTFLIHPIDVANFSLIDQHQQNFTQENLRNHWTFIYFGFTHCQYACPVTLSALNQMYQILQKKLSANKLPQILFISVDPERDTTADLAKYVEKFNPRFLSAKTTPEKTKTLQKMFHLSTGSAITDHDTEILLINPQVKIQAYFAFPAQPEKMAQAYCSILGS